MWRNAYPMHKKSADAAGAGIASALPIINVTREGNCARAIMPALGSTPITCPVAPTKKSACRAVNPVPTPMSRTRIPGPRPARLRARRRYQDPDPRAMNRSIRS